MMLMEAMQKYQETNTGTQLSLEEFAVLYLIFHFDVSKTFTASLRFSNDYRNQVDYW
jgi:hypothetical protein